jgi:hypothetical protein
LNEFDRFVVHELKPKNYLRYGDDFILFTNTKEEAENFRNKATCFLQDRLSLSVNSKNDIIIKVPRGIYFLGVDIFPSGRRLKERVWKKIVDNLSTKNFSSYGGLVRKHANKRKIKELDWRIFNISNRLW